MARVTLAAVGLCLMVMFMLGNITIVEADYVPAAAPSPAHRSSNDRTGGYWKSCHEYWDNPPAYFKC